MTKPQPVVFELITGLDIGGKDGGRERYAIELCRHFDHSKVRPILVIFWKRGGLAEAAWIKWLEREGIVYRFLSNRVGNFSVKDFSAGISALEKLCAEQTQPVILHSHYQLGTLAGIGLRLRHRVQFLIRTLHINTPEWSEYRRWGWLGRIIFSNFLFPLCCDLQAGVSETAQKNLQNQFINRIFNKPAVLLSNGLPDHLLVEIPKLAAMPVSMPFQSNGKVIGSVGRLSEQKGHADLLRAMVLVLQRMSDTELILVGDGELRSELENLSRELKIDNHVWFLGKQENVYPYLARMDLFVLSSLWEGLPTVILEAMAAGTPVLATDIPGNRDLIRPGETGWLAPVANPTGLAESILLALTDIDRQKRIQTASQEIVHYSMGNIADEHIHYFEEYAPSLFRE